jgi:hypothetical protein
MLRVAPLQILLLAVGSMFWPLLLVVVLIALRTSRPLSILVWFYLGGLITTVTVGAALVLVLRGGPDRDCHRRLLPGGVRVSGGADGGVRRRPGVDRLVC